MASHKKVIGEVHYAPGTSPHPDKIELYEAIQVYQEGVTCHTYILAKDREEAIAVQEAWLKRNDVPGQEKPVKESRLRFLLDMDDSQHKRAGPMVLVGPSLSASPQVGDKINL